MSNAFTRSWDVTKATFHVMRQDKELLAYPLLSGFFSSLFILVVFLPIVILLYVNNTSQIALIEYVALFIMKFERICYYFEKEGNYLRQNLNFYGHVHMISENLIKDSKI